MEELKPCPFCKGKNIKAVDCDTGAFSANSYVECKDCHAVVFGETYEKAIAAWNKRAYFTCEGCVFEGLYASNCSFCNRDPRLIDQFIAKVVE